MSTPYLANEILFCLLGAALVGGLMGWFLKLAGTRSLIAKVTAEHDQTLSTTEQELQRVSSELAGQNRRAADAVAALDPLKARVEETEAKLITSLLEKDNEIAKAKEQRAEVERLRAALAETEKRTTIEVAERQDLIDKLELHVAGMTPLANEVAGLRAEAAAWERKSRQVEQYNQTQMAQQQSELSLLRSRIAELEPLPAQLVDRDARLRELDIRHRATEAAWQSRLATLEGAVRVAENKVVEAANTMAVAEQQTARVLDERAAEIRMLKHRIAEMEPRIGRTLTPDAGQQEHALQQMRAQLAARDAEVTQLRAERAQPMAMAAAAGAGMTALVPAAVTPVEPKPLTPAELQGCLQALLFEKRLQFTPKSAELTPESADVLHEIAGLMEQAPGVPVVIEGHTDNWGDPHTNWQLSVWRAEAVKRDLMGRGVAEERMSSIGYGEARPVDDNSTPDGRWRNRRIEIRVAPNA